MGIPIFLSYPNPYNDVQSRFIKQLSDNLLDRNIVARTLGVTDYDPDVPLKAIRRLMIESNGLIAVAFRRTRISEGVSKPDTENATVVEGQWLTSPWAHIEPAMAFQIGLPILILRESDVVADGVLERGVVGSYMPDFDLSNPDMGVDYLETEQWKQILVKWEGQVRAVVENKGNPPKLY